MDPLERDPGQRRQPAAHVVAIRVVLVALHNVVQHVVEGMGVCRRESVKVVTKQLSQEWNAKNGAARQKVVTTEKRRVSEHCYLCHIQCWRQSYAKQDLTLRTAVWSLTNLPKAWLQLCVSAQFSSCLTRLTLGFRVVRV